MKIEVFDFIDSTSQTLPTKVVAMNPSSMSSRTLAIQGCVDRLKEGDESAKEELLKLAGDRLMVLTRKMKQDYRNVGRWEQTEDVCQNALIRLHRALAVREINDAEHFLRLAAKQIRRELIDLARKHKGAEGWAANHASQVGLVNAENSRAPVAFDPAEMTNDPAALCEWGEFHELIEQLPDEQRNVVDLILYHGMTQAEAAEVLAIAIRSVKRHWRAARLALYDKLGGRLPGE